MRTLFGKLKDAGVLGINLRNGHYLARYNAKQRYALADDKRRTKDAAVAFGIPVPALYALFEHPSQVELLHTTLSPYRRFVVKPACGMGGEGIIIVSDRVEHSFHLADGSVLDFQTLKLHIMNILAGTFSLGGRADHALMEYRVLVHPTMSDFSGGGVPDVRIVTLLGVPVMAMLRVPTQVSQGKANLHQGAIGVGIDLSTGRTLGGVSGDRSITHHPDSKVSLSGFLLPRWQDFLSIASRCCDMSGLGYLGVDIVLDAEHGPLMLEINARPGLSIQIANRAGLVPRLQLVEQEAKNLGRTEERVRFAQEQFTA